MEVYLDNSATTAVFPQVADLMYKIMYKNKNPIHYINGGIFIWKK